jgi:uncharacterized protein (TIGR03435 family)
MRFLVLFLASCAAYAQPGAPLQFEVASLKPSPPADGGGYIVGCHGGAGTDDPAMLVCENMGLFGLITMAYRIEPYQLSAPDWTINTRFELRAAIPAGTTKDQQEAMLRALLEERFKLVAHRETREMSRYDLVVAKGGPKFKETVPPPAKRDEKAGWFPPKVGADGYPVLARGRASMAIMYDRARLYDPEMTMERLAVQLSGQMHGPVTDATGLKGKYEISLYWSAVNGTRADVNADPGPPLEVAVREQLGLRLESKKGPFEIVVVDSAEKAPSGN